MNVIDQSLKEAYGKYEIPEEILQLHQLESGLQRKGLSLAMIGLIPTDSYEPYSITPPDLIPIANTGGDGIHFGFLTDFGVVEHLSDAPIVCVTPTNDPPIRLIARNIKAFMDLVASVRYVEDLEQWWGADNETTMLDQAAEYQADTPFLLRRKRKKIHDRFRETFHTEEKEPLSYIREVRQEREHQVVIATYDGLGILNGSERDEAHKRFEFKAHTPPAADEIERMRAFFSEGSRASRLAFIRDVWYLYVMIREEQDDFRDLLRECFQVLHLQDEEQRMFN